MTVPHCGTAPNIPYPGVTGIRQVYVPLQKRRCSGSDQRQIKRNAEHQKAHAELSPLPLNCANSFQHKGSIKKMFPTGITEGWMPPRSQEQQKPVPGQSLLMLQATGSKTACRRAPKRDQNKRSLRSPSTEHQWVWAGGRRGSLPLWQQE